ncbi:MAG: lanthionine synthetase LanC family protein [Rhodobacter sp.]|nr:lanthionine synthetase LanC family protein [Rhodobacter sp.]
MTVKTEARPVTSDHDQGLAIAHELAEAAIWHGPLCTFQGAVPADEIGLPPLQTTTGGDVYEGSAGIARFLLLASRFDDDLRLVETAQGALRHALSNANGASLYSGVPGAAIVALEADWPQIRSDAMAMLAEAAAAASNEADPPMDLLSGHAGLIVGLVAVSRSDPSGPWADLAAALGHQVVDAGRADGDGLSWPVAPGQDDHLCGLAHGAAGLAYAMDRLLELAPDAGPWRDTAHRARRFERAWYSPEHGSWADLRSDAMGPEAEPGYPHMWCHGSIGIAADRLVADASDILARADRVAALEGVLASTRDALAGPRGPGGSDAINGSQCHGLSGVSDLMIDAWRLSGQKIWLDMAAACSAAIRDDARRPEGWRCGVPGGHYSPGLMLGVAGIGWSLMRTAHPDTVPSAWKIGGLL